MLDLYLNEIGHPDSTEPGQTGDAFFPSSYITHFKVTDSKSTQMFYVKCMSYISSFSITYSAKI